LYSPTCPYSGDVGFAQMSVTYLMNKKKEKRKEKERKKEQERIPVI
jgi:hypothetical protein